MIGFTSLLVKYRKIILIVSFVALVIAGISLPRFDPSHPKSLVAECIQALPQTIEKISFFFVAAFGLLILRILHRKDIPAGAYEMTRSPLSVGSGGYYLPHIFDPLIRALREGIVHNRSHP